MSEPCLLPEHIRALRIAIEAAMDARGAAAMLAGADGTWARGAFVQLGSMVIAAHPGDGQGKAPHYVAYEADTELDALDDAQMLFVLDEGHFTPTLDPNLWYGRLLAAIDAAFAAQPADATR